MVEIYSIRKDNTLLQIAEVVSSRLITNILIRNLSISKQLTLGKLQTYFASNANLELWLELINI